MLGGGGVALDEEMGDGVRGEAEGGAEAYYTAADYEDWGCGCVDLGGSHDVRVVYLSN